MDENMKYEEGYTYSYADPVEALHMKREYGLKFKKGILDDCENLSDEEYKDVRSQLVFINCFHERGEPLYLTDESAKELLSVDHTEFVFLPKKEKA